MSETRHDKKNIAVIFGGCSPEYQISLQSASSVIENLDREKYEPILIGISREGKWYLYRGPVENIRQDKWLGQKVGIDIHRSTMRQTTIQSEAACSGSPLAKGDDSATCYPAFISPDRGSHQLLVFGGSSESALHSPCGEKNERNIRLTVTECIHLDAAIPVLHGKNGEDGSVQGLLALADIPLAGCGILASALCMDKDLAHRLAASAGIQVPRALTLKGLTESRSACVASFVEEVGFPLFVKPVKSGSSLGITKVSSPEDMAAAIERALTYDDDVIIEENIDGFEVGCAIIGRHHLTVGEPDEICLEDRPQTSEDKSDGKIAISDGFFDYTEKYTLDHSTIYVPARVSKEKACEIRRSAVAIYRALGCSGFARVDMFLTPSGQLVFNEVNTIPGFTPHSRFPAMMKAAGMDFGTLLDMILTQALEERSPYSGSDSSDPAGEVI